MSTREEMVRQAFFGCRPKLDALIIQCYLLKAQPQWPGHVPEWSGATMRDYIGYGLSLPEAAWTAYEAEALLEGVN